MARFCIDVGCTLLLAAALTASGSAGATLVADRVLRASDAAVGRVVGDYSFTDGDGKRVRLSDYRGKPLIVSFVYTGCSRICPTTTRSLATAVRGAQQALGREAFNVATIGFDLPFDTPAAMKSFAARQSIDVPHWNFLSPDAQALDALLRDFGFGAEAAAEGIDHVAQVSIVDANGRVFRQIYGEALDAPQLLATLRDVAGGLPEPREDISDLIRRVRILCSLYDPRTGEYRLNYALFIEIFAGFSVLGATAWYVSTEWRRQRRPRRAV